MKQRKSKEIVIGIDLHGTLIDDAWRISPLFYSQLKVALENVGRFSLLYICSGNDLTFLKTYIPKDILALFKGYVLETGCVIGFGEKETVITPPEKVSLIKRLENQLKKMEFPEVKYFARRLSSISLFTRDESGGSEPEILLPKIEHFITTLGYSKQVMITHSNVAVDIIPVGFNKYTGILHVSQGRPIIGIADSYNDLHLISDADLAFIPANSSTRLIHALRQMGKSIQPLRKNNRIPKNTILQSQYFFTESVLDILKFIFKNHTYLENIF